MTMTEEIDDLNTKLQTNINKANEQLYEKKTNVKLENVSVHVIMYVTLLHLESKGSIVPQI